MRWRPLILRASVLTMGVDLCAALSPPPRQVCMAGFESRQDKYNSQPDVVVPLHNEGRLSQLQSSTSGTAQRQVAELQRQQKTMVRVLLHA